MMQNIMLFKGFSTTSTPTVNEILIDCAVASVCKILLQQILYYAVFKRSPYFMEMLHGAPRWSYFINIGFQIGCFIPFGIYAFMQYEDLESFLNCNWETYLLPWTRIYGTMLTSYMARDILNCLYSMDLILHHAAGFGVTIWAMCQSCSLELYLCGVSALEIGSMFNNLAVICDTRTRVTLLFVNNFIFFAGHVVGMYLNCQIFFGNADASYRYFLFIATTVMCILRTKAVFELYKRDEFSANNSDKQKLK